MIQLYCRKDVDLFILASYLFHFILSLFIITSFPSFPVTLAQESKITFYSGALCT